MKKLGELLIEKHLINPTQLTQALQRKDATGGRLGTNLIEMMLIDEATLGEILAVQKNVPSVNPMVLEKIGVDVLNKLPRTIAENYVAIPFKLEGKRLHVAMLDPGNIKLLDDLSHRSGYIIKPYVCSEAVLFKALNRHYDIPPPLRKTGTAVNAIPDIIVHDTSGIISLDDTGQFTLVDRTDLLGKNTKKMFLEAASRTAIIGFFLQFLGYTCDKVAFLAYDGGKNFLWKDAKAFQEGRQGLVLGEQINRSVFWTKYLSQPSFFYTRLPTMGNDMNWVNPMLELPDCKALFIAPCQVSKTILGAAVGGSSAIFRLEEELETIKKLHLMTVSALKIYELRKLIEGIS